PQLAFDTLHDPIARLGGLWPFQSLNDHAPLQGEVAENNVRSLAIEAATEGFVHKFEDVSANYTMLTRAMREHIVAASPRFERAMLGIDAAVCFREPGALGRRFPRAHLMHAHALRRLCQNRRTRRWLLTEQDMDEVHVTTQTCREPRAR